MCLSRSTVTPVKEILNVSLNSGDLPTVWKKLPVISQQYSKKGNGHFPLNCRPTVFLLALHPQFADFLKKLLKIM